MKRLLSVALACLAVLGARGALATDDLVVYAHLEDRHAHLGADFVAIVSNGLDELARYTVVTEGKIEATQGLAERLVAARAAGVLTLAEARLTASGRNRSTFDLSFYDTRTAEITFNWRREYKAKSVEPLLALIESEMPLELKLRLREVGRIIKKERQLVYFDLGSLAGVEEGDIYPVFERGQVLKNADGHVFGWLKKTTGIVRVTTVNSTYSAAEILLGRISLANGHFVERTAAAADNYHGTILSVLDDEVAISLGANHGVEEGAYFGVFKEIKPINEQESFRESIGQIRINEVYDDFAKGRLALSQNYRLAKALLTEGDRIEEIESPRRRILSVGQISTDILGDTGTTPVLGLEFDSGAALDLVYRLRAGYKDDLFASAGLMSSIGNSPDFFYGLDAVYFDGAGANIFVSANIPTPIARNVQLNLEAGYMVGVGDYEGLHTTLALKIPLF